MTVFNLLSMLQANTLVSMLSVNLPTSKLKPDFTAKVRKTYLQEQCKVMVQTSDIQECQN